MEKQKLITKRKELGLSQQELAERVSMTQSTYSRKEKGTAPIFSEEWERIAKVLNIDKDEIFEENSQVNFNYQNKGGNNAYYIVTESSELIKESFNLVIEAKDDIIKKQSEEIAFLRELLKQKNENSL